MAVLNRDLKQEARSEDEAGLSACVAFGPDGGLIAAAQRSEGKHDIIFFEPNGLRHYEFALPRMDAAVGMGWNVDGSLLCVMFGGDEARAAQVWHRSNYKWYLKHEQRGATAFLWDRMAPLTLHVSLPASRDKRGGSLSIAFAWEYCVSRGSEPELSTIASSDMGRVLLTPLGRLIVPPPMSASCLDTGDDAVNATAWGPEGRLAVLGSGQIRLSHTAHATRARSPPAPSSAHSSSRQHLFSL